MLKDLPVYPADGGVGLGGIGPRGRLKTEQLHTGRSVGSRLALEVEPSAPKTSSVHDRRPATLTERWRWTVSCPLRLAVLGYEIERPV